MKTQFKMRYILGIILILCWPLFNYISTMKYSQAYNVRYRGMLEPEELLALGNSCLKWGIGIIVVTEIIFIVQGLIFHFRQKNKE